MTTHSDKPSDDEFVFDDESHLQNPDDVGGPAHEDQVVEFDADLASDDEMAEVDFVLDEEFFEDDGSEFVIEEIEDADLFQPSATADADEFVLESEEPASEFDSNDGEFVLEGDGSEFVEEDLIDLDATATAEEDNFLDEETDFVDAEFEMEATEAELELESSALGPLEPESFEPESFEPESFEPESFEPESFEPESFEPESFEPESFESESFESASFESESLGFDGGDEEEPEFESEVAETSFGAGRDTEFESIESDVEGEIAPEEPASVYGEISLRDDGEVADFAEMHSDDEEDFLGSPSELGSDFDAEQPADEQEALASMFDSEVARRQSGPGQVDEVSQELFATPPAQFSENGFEDDGGLSAGERVAAIGDFDLEPTETDDDLDSLEGFDTDSDFEIESLDGEVFEDLEDEIEVVDSDTQTFALGAADELMAQSGLDSTHEDPVDLEPELVDEVGHTVHSVLDEATEGSDSEMAWSDDLELVVVDEEEEDVALDDDVSDFEDADLEDDDPIYGEDVDGEDEVEEDDYVDDEADYEELQPVVATAPSQLRVIGGGRRMGGGWRAAAAAAIILLAAGVGGVVVMKPELLGLEQGAELVDVTEVARPRLALAPSEPVLPAVAIVEETQPTIDEPVDPEVVDPSTTNPIAVQEGDPESTGPEVTDPEATDPETTDPEPNGPIAINDGQDEPIVPDPVDTDPDPLDPSFPTGPNDPIAVLDTPRVESNGTSDEPIRLEPLRLGDDLEAQELARDLPNVVAAVSPGERALARLENASVFVGRVKKLGDSFVTLDLMPGEVSLKRDELEVLVPVDLADAEGPTLQQGEVRLRNTERLVGRVVRPEGRGVVAIESDSTRILVPLSEILEVRSRTPGDTAPIIEGVRPLPAATPAGGTGR
ncbi:MAG: hypothetical protein AAF196_09635 [Planctomycetota bacterium]